VTGGQGRVKRETGPAIDLLVCDDRTKEPWMATACLPHFS
jgi:hypothetical protein